MRKYLIVISGVDTSQYGKEFKQQFIVRGYQNAMTIVNDVLKYQAFTGESVFMHLIQKSK